VEPTEPVRGVSRLGTTAGGPSDLRCRCCVFSGFGAGHIGGILKRASILKPIIQRHGALRCHPNTEKQMKLRYFAPLASSRCAAPLFGTERRADSTWQQRPGQCPNHCSPARRETGPPNSSQPFAGYRSSALLFQLTDNDRARGGDLLPAVRALWPTQPANSQLRAHGSNTTEEHKEEGTHEQVRMCRRRSQRGSQRHPRLAAPAQASTSVTDSDHACPRSITSRPTRPPRVGR